MKMMKFKTRYGIGARAALKEIIERRCRIATGRRMPHVPVTLILGLPPFDDDASDDASWCRATRQYSGGAHVVD